MDATWFEELREFVAIPSVSADPAHQDDVRRAAEWVRDFVKRIGGEAELVPMGERDLVIGDIPANTNGAAAPTVMIYGHFDVQPPAPLDLWESPPFELDERDGWYYARGIADDKGQLYTLLKAAELLLRETPCRSTSASLATARRRSAATRSSTSSTLTSAARTLASSSTAA